MPPLYRRSSDKNLVFPYSSDCSLAKLLAPLSLWPGKPKIYSVTCSKKKTGINYKTLNLFFIKTIFMIKAEIKEETKNGLDSTSYNPEM